MLQPQARQASAVKDMWSVIRVLIDSRLQYMYICSFVLCYDSVRHLSCIYKKLVWSSIVLNIWISYKYIHYIRQRNKLFGHQERMLLFEHWKPSSYDVSQNNHIHAQITLRPPGEFRGKKSFLKRLILFLKKDKKKGFPVSGLSHWNILTDSKVLLVIRVSYMEPRV